MSDNDKYNLDDIINFSAEQRPVDVKAALDDLMIAKIHSAIEDKKVEVAKQMFGDAASQDDVDLTDDESDEEWNDEEETDDESDDFDLDISDDELEDLLNDLVDNIEDDDLEDDLEVDNLDSEEDDNGENA